MKKRKTTPKQYNITEQENSNIVQEPEVTYQTTTSNNTLAMMGMQSNMQFQHISSESDYIEVIREGVPKAALTNLMAKTGITISEIANITHLTDRTLRRYENADKLPQEQSERVIELARLYSKGSDVFGSLDFFKEWMNTSLVPLGSQKPKAFLDTSLGIEMLLKELGRIEHGVFA